MLFYESRDKGDRMASERVQKILAQAGISSRRKAEDLISSGEVTINGKLAKLGDKAEWGKDAIKVKGKLLLQSEPLIYLAFHKPKAVISMLSDSENRPTLAEYLTKIKSRIFPIGRLDFNSEGLILLTNDGAFAEKLQKSDQVLRTYAIKVKGHPDKEMITRLEKGAWIGHVRKKLLKPHSVRLTEELPSKSLIEVCVLGGGAFDMKGLFEAKGYLVEKIVRKAIGHITLKGLPSGHFRYLKETQVLALLNQPELAMRKHEYEMQTARPIPVKRVLKPVSKIRPVSSSKKPQFKDPHLKMPVFTQKPQTEERTTRVDSMRKPQTRTARSVSNKNSQFQVSKPRPGSSRSTSRTRTPRK